MRECVIHRPFDEITDASPRNIVSILGRIAHGVPCRVIWPHNTERSNQMRITMSIVDIVTADPCPMSVEFILFNVSRNRQRMFSKLKIASRNETS